MSTSSVNSILCSHQNLKRISDDFVRCLICGNSFVSQKKLPQVKTPQDFLRENNGLFRNFDRNFNNEVPIDDTQEEYDYYVSRRNRDRMIVDHIPVQGKLRIKFNNKIYYATRNDLEEIIAQHFMVRVDKTQYDSVVG